MSSENLKIEEEILSADQIAEMLGVSKRIVEDKLRNGELQGYKRFSKWYVFKSDLFVFIQEGESSRK